MPLNIKSTAITLEHKQHLYYFVPLTCWCWSEKCQLWSSRHRFSPRFSPAVKKIIHSSLKFDIIWLNIMCECDAHRNVPGWRRQSHFHLLFWGWGAESSRWPTVTEESFYSQNDSLFQPNSQFYRGNCFIIHLYSDSDSLTVMMVSRKAQISGFTLCRSAKIFSFPLMKPHLGAEVGRGEIRHFIHRHEHFVSTPKKR